MHLAVRCFSAHVGSTRLGRFEISDDRSGGRALRSRARPTSRVFSSSSANESSPDVADPQIVQAPSPTRREFPGAPSRRRHTPASIASLEQPRPIIIEPGSKRPHVIVERSRDDRAVRSSPRPRKDLVIAIHRTALARSGVMDERVVMKRVAIVQARRHRFSPARRRSNRSRTDRSRSPHRGCGPAHVPATEKIGSASATRRCGPEPLRNRAKLRFAGSHVEDARFARKS